MSDDELYECPGCGEVATQDELEEDTEAFGVKYVCPDCGYTSEMLADFPPADDEGDEE